MHCAADPRYILFPGNRLLRTGLATYEDSSTGFYEEFPNASTVSPSRILLNPQSPSTCHWKEEVLRAINDAKMKIPDQTKELLAKIKDCKQPQDLWNVRLDTNLLPRNVRELERASLFVLHAMDTMSNNIQSVPPPGDEYEAGVRARGVSPFTENVFRSMLGFRVAASEIMFVSSQVRIGDKRFHKADFFAVADRLPGFELFVTESKISGAAPGDIQSDQAKLFRMQKDSLDRIIISFTITAISIRPIVFGLQSVGTVLKLYAMIRPYSNAVVCLQLLEVNTTWGRHGCDKFAELLELMLAISFHCEDIATALLTTPRLELAVPARSVINATPATPKEKDQTRSGGGRGRRGGGGGGGGGGTNTTAAVPSFATVKLKSKCLMGFKEFRPRVGRLSLSCTGLTSVQGQRLVIKLLRDHESWQQELHVHAYVTQRQVCLLLVHVHVMLHPVIYA